MTKNTIFQDPDKLKKIMAATTGALVGSGLLITANTAHADTTAPVSEPVTAANTTTSTTADITNTSATNSNATSDASSSNTSNTTSSAVSDTTSSVASDSSAVSDATSSNASDVTSSATSDTTSNASSDSSATSDATSSTASDSSADSSATSSSSDNTSDNNTSDKDNNQDLVKVAVQFIDTTDNNKVVGNALEISGKPGTTGTFNITAPEGYTFAKGQDSTITYAFKDSDNQPLLVKLIHAFKEVTTTDKYTNAQITRTINVTNPVDGKTSSTKQVAKFTRKAYEDQVTKKIVYTAWNLADNGWTAFTVPTINGYTPSQTEVKAETPTSNMKNQTIDITYTGNEQSQIVKYVDSKGNTVGQQVIKGKTGDKINNQLQAPEGYQLAKDLGDEKITADGAVIRVQVTKDSATDNTAADTNTTDSNTTANNTNNNQTADNNTAANNTNSSQTTDSNTAATTTGTSADDTPATVETAAGQTSTLASSASTSQPTVATLSAGAPQGTTTTTAGNTVNAASLPQTGQANEEGLVALGLAGATLSLGLLAKKKKQA